MPDGTLAGVLQYLLAHHPRAIGVDLYRDIPLAPGTDALAALLNAHREIIVARKYGDQASGGVPPPAYLDDKGQAGCVDLPLDGDNRVRRALVYLGGEEACGSLGYLLALRYLSHAGISPLGEPGRPDSLRLGKSSLPRLRAFDGGYRGLDERGYQILLDFRHPPSSFRRYSFGDALDGCISPADIDGKIVLIGTDAESSKGYFSIPDIAPGDVSQKTSGIKLHGLLADQLLRAALQGDQALKTLPEWQELAWLLCWCLAGVALGAGKRPVWVLVPFQILGLAAAAAVHALFSAGIWMPLVPASLGWLASTAFTTAWAARREHRQRDALMNLFARHVDGRIADELWRRRGEFLSGGTITPQRMTATVLFSDLAGFTPIAERLEPEVFIGWLNECLDAMTTLINRHDGVVIRFIGDAVMAGFGVPVPRSSAAEMASDANRAARCALDIQEMLVRLNRRWASENLPVVAMRIGINTGTLLADSLGGTDRLEYTIHGDTVNIAARLESHEKAHFKPDFFASPCRILIGEATERLLSPEFMRTPLGNLALKGKAKPTGVFRLESLRKAGETRFDPTMKRDQHAVGDQSPGFMDAQARNPQVHIKRWQPRGVPGPQALAGSRSVMLDHVRLGHEIQLSGVAAYNPGPTHKTETSDEIPRPLANPEAV